MEYHARKMKEVNDTMRHLWNKTYQGTGKTARFLFAKRGILIYNVPV